MKLKPRCTLLAALLIMLVMSAAWAQTEPRGHLTAPEVDLVKEAQILDKRIEVFVKAAERRFVALNNATAPQAKPNKKDVEKWGAMPTGTRAELLSDVAKILDEAIVNIDDVSAHDEKNVLIPKALRRLSVAATAFLPQLASLNAQANGEDERAAIVQAVDHAQSIIDAANKLPPPPSKKKEKSAQP